VSGVGDDANPCSRTAPCKTFAGAISKTAINGEINSLDNGAFGNLNITKSITVDSPQNFAGVNFSQTNGVLVNFDAFLGTDTRKSVRLRNIVYQGGDTGLRAIRIFGGASSAGSEVSIEDCVIDGAFGSPGRGIEDARSGGGKLFVSNTTFRNLGGTAISHAINGSTRLDWTITNVRIFNCLFGIAMGSGGRVNVSNTVITGCTNAGLFVEGPLGAAELHANNVVLNNNGVGLQQNAGGTLRIGNSEITNSTANGTSGTILSYGNNRTGGNAGATVLTPIAGDSHDKGQQ
jgi:hypothetical protein